MNNPMVTDVLQHTVSHKDGDCENCDKRGLLVLPLLYSILATEVQGALNAAPALGGTLGKGVTDIKLGQAKYGVRMIRELFIYVLVNRQGLRYWQAYYGVPGGQLYSFPAGDPPPRVQGEVSCARMAQSPDAMCVSFERPKDVQMTYWLATPDPLSEAKLNEYKANADRFAAEGKMQKFDIKAWVGSDGQGPQPHALTPDQLHEQVLEFIAAGPAAPTPVISGNPSLAKALDEQPYPALRDPMSAASPLGPAVQQAAGHLRNVQEKLKREKGAAFVLYDALGITQALNAWRNGALEGMQPWMAQTDKAGASNEWKFHVATRLLEVREGIKEHRIQAVNQQWEAEGADKLEEVAYSRHPDPNKEKRDRLIREAKERNGGYVTEKEMLLINYGTPDANKRARDDFIKSAKKVRDGYFGDVLEKRRERAGKSGWEQYAGDVDFEAAEKHVAEFDRRAAPCEAKMRERVADHLVWVKSKHVLDALHAYDPNHVLYGWAFSIQTSLAMLGMEASDDGQALLETWWRDVQIAESNLAWRTYALNQEDIQNKTRQALAEAKAKAAQGESITVKEAIEAAHTAVSKSKAVIDAFEKANKALDQTEKALAPMDWFARSKLGFVLGWYAQAAKAVFSFAVPSAGDRVLARTLTWALQWRLGKFATELRLHELEAKGLPVQIAAVRGQMKRRIREGVLAEMNAGKAGNFFALRLGIILSLFESVQLYFKAQEMPEGKKEKAEFAAAALGTLAGGLELTQTGAEWISGRYGAASVTGRAATMWGQGLRLYGGFLGSVGGTIGLVLDFGESAKQARKGRLFLAGAYSVRAIAVGGITALSQGVVISASGPYLNAMMQRTENRVILALLRGAERVAMRLAADVVVTFMRTWLARASWATAALMVVIWILEPDAMEEWCERSVFSKHKGEKRFANEAEELAELDVAFAMVTQ